MRERPKIKVNIVLEIDSCESCPKNGRKLTKGYGYAYDNFCTMTKDNKITSGYVEWPSEVNPVPDWCPLLCDVVSETK